MDMFLKNITFLIFFVKTSAKMFFLFIKVRGAGDVLKITAGAEAASFLAGSDSLIDSQLVLLFWPFKLDTYLFSAQFK